MNQIPLTPEVNITVDDDGVVRGLSFGARTFLGFAFGVVFSFIGLLVHLFAIPFDGFSFILVGSGILAQFFYWLGLWTFIQAMWPDAIPNYVQFFMSSVVTDAFIFFLYGGLTYFLLTPLVYMSFHIYLVFTVKNKKLEQATKNTDATSKDEEEPEEGTYAPISYLKVLSPRDNPTILLDDMKVGDADDLIGC
jgi:hypothetical protein